ncbi:MAG: DUF1615 family protein, partial [SAR324 cluster bacterium]|nr:DUF1615 family protein [SAR324 cluster bacterium]
MSNARLSRSTFPNSSPRGCLWPIIAPALLLVLALGACDRRLQPPAPSYKLRDYYPTAAAPPPASVKEPSGERVTAPTPSTPLKAPPQQRTRSTARTARVAPPAAPSPGGKAYDPGRPCFTRGQMARGQAVLFGGEPDARGPRWARALNRAFHDLEVPCNDEDFLVLVLTIIQLESGVAVDPPLENANLEALFTYQLERLREGNPLAGPLLDYSKLDEAMRAKLRKDTRRGHVRTEGQLVRYVENDLRQWLREYLQSEYFLPERLARYAAEQGLPNPVNTLGPMQVNLHKAYANARRRGERVESPEQMRRWLLAPETALERGLKEGVYQLWRVYRYYRRRLPAQEAVRYATADYNAGEFSSRNAAFQARVGHLIDRELVLDGDLLLYRNGQPAERASNTEAAVITLLKHYAAPRIRRDLLLEKHERFSR